ncbi:MAG: 16S rRNA (guanine(966)-N(2))-methyltransferase RsmD [Clostridia bacterium]|nr:16S rRNA (guanine(966)-N(2))-methyltransferase RsmD [Clostridia bacterium]MBQ7120930.1 16S rRNA (guanine(966)-N(2))-methyltransferase RsmD [Clostridia bacterium]
MRVITGKARGTTLKTLEGINVRPTTDKVKEAVFSAFQFEIEGRRILDLFAGSGQLGIEALSRDAHHAVFVDADKNAIRVIKENLAKTKLDSFATVVQTDSIAFLSMTDKIFDIAFLDPPYETGLLQKALSKIGGCIAEGGAVICEHPFKEELADEYGGLVRVKDYKYSKTAVTVYRKEG